MANMGKFRASKRVIAGTIGKQDRDFVTPHRNAHSTFSSRRACAKAGVHIAPFAGIAGSAEHGAYSVVLSGGYEDDEDHGDML